MRQAHPLPTSTTLMTLQGVFGTSTLPGHGGSIGFSYSNAGWLTKIASPAYTETIESYDNLGNPLKKTIGEAKANYRFDDLYQLTTEDGLFSNTFEHDSLFNCVNKNGKTSAINALNQLLSDGESTFSYDRNGNLLLIKTGNEEISLGYDALDRLISYTKGGEKTLYAYDESNRRLSKTLLGQTLAIENYLYHGNNEVGSADSQNRLTALRILGLGKGSESGAALFLRLNDRTLLPLHDMAGGCMSAFSTRQPAPSSKRTATAPLAKRPPSPSSTPGATPVSASTRKAALFTSAGATTPRLEPSDRRRPDGLAGPPRAYFYAYVLNNPLLRYDLYGLYGLSDAYDSFKEFGKTTLFNLRRRPDRRLPPSDRWHYRGNCVSATIPLC